MVSKSLKRSSTKSIKDTRIQNCSHRGQRKKSPAKNGSVIASSKILSSINKTIFTCKRRIAKIFSKLARISTPKTKYKGYKILKKNFLKSKEDEDEEEAAEDFLDFEKDSICKLLIFKEEHLLPPLIYPSKKTVFLDLDETLVHSKPNPPPERFDFVVRPKIDGEFMDFYVLKRPGVDDFLAALGQKYELVVFTAGLKEYASLVLDRLDKKKVISHRLYRDSCKQVDGKYVKDLSEMGRDLKKVVIVDDNPNCYVFQPHNAIPVKPFIDDLGDGELRKLGKFLVEGCEGFDDMRDAVKEFVGNEGEIRLKEVEL